MCSGNCELSRVGACGASDSPMENVRSRAAQSGSTAAWSSDSGPVPAAAAAAMLLPSAASASLPLSSAIAIKVRSVSETLAFASCAAHRA